MKIGMSRCFANLAIAGVLFGCTRGERGRDASAPVQMEAPPSSGGMEFAAPASETVAPAAPEESDLDTLRPSASVAPAEPSRRPGLATAWGETRTSHVHDVPFTRASGTPFAVGSLRYDDWTGVDALAGRRGQLAAPSGSEMTLGHGAVALSIRDEDGSAMEMWTGGGQSYVVGHDGQRYTIVLDNRSPHPFEVVVTVDGLDVMDGKPGSIAKRGYLMGPYATFEIEGFRRSEDAVAAFRFGRVGDSYAARTGSARDVGVIGAAIFAMRGDGFGGEDDTRERAGATPFPGDARYAQPPR